MAQHWGNHSAGSVILSVCLLSLDACGVQQNKTEHRTSPDYLPEMVSLPQGDFLMGSPQGETDRYEDEGPQHKVTISYSVWLARTETTVAQFRYFVQQSGYMTDAEKLNYSHVRNPENGMWEEKPGVNWRHDNSGLPSKDNNPVVHVSWNDAKAYVEWLATTTGESYRLPSEAEMEYAIRGGTVTRFWWGNKYPDKRVANLKGEHDVPASDLTWFPTANERQFAYAQGYTPFLFENYGDGFWGLAPVGSFDSNPFGLHDTTGNVWEWVEDCWHDSYHGAPDNGKAWKETGVCSYRVLRGGSYYCFPRHTRSANRWKLKQDYRGMYVGFRVARGPG